MANQSDSPGSGEIYAFIRRSQAIPRYITVKLCRMATDGTVSDLIATLVGVRVKKQLLGYNKCLLNVTVSLPDGSEFVERIKVNDVFHDSECCKWMEINHDTSECVLA